MGIAGAGREAGRRATGELPPFLEAAAIKRVLHSSRDFNALIYTAINIQAMNGKKGAWYLLQDEVVQARLEELVNSPDKMLASAFCGAFSHLLLGVQYVGLFVQQAHRHIYFPTNSLSQQHQYYKEPHPLSARVTVIYDRFSKYLGSLDVRPDTLVEMLLYFELLKLLLDEKSQKEDLSKWMDGIIQKQQSAKVSTPLVICLVADTVRILNEGIESVDAASGAQAALEGPDSEQEEQERLKQRQERILKVQGQSVGVIKKVVCAVGWKMKLVPSDLCESRRKSALGLIEEAFSIDNSRSLRHPDKTEIWILEQAFLISTSNLHEPGWQFVATGSVGLLLSFDNSEDPVPDSIGTQDSLQDNRHRCIKILSQCIQVTRDHLGPNNQTVSPALNKVVDYWARFNNNFTQNPDLNDSDMLSSWFEIRGALDKPGESGWGPLNQQLFGEAYPSLKSGFDTMASVMSDNAPRVDNTTEHRSAALDGQAGRTEPDGAVTDLNTPKPDEHSDPPQEGAGESREHEDAPEPSSVERNEQPDEQGGYANPTQMSQDE
ncbi:hypothetical protein FS837_001701 [Tulasnella sp. UAMH 9824]|nr:hypothetical protein FS837_001701 [Tulasnella sp. UAMH 9824]